MKLHTSMSFHATALRRSFPTVFLLALIAAPTAFGQATNAKGELISPIKFVNQDAITTSFVSAPNVGGSLSGSPSDNNQWLKVEFHYGTTPVLKTNYLDSVEFRVWIEGLDLFGKNAPVPVK